MSKRQGTHSGVKKTGYLLFCLTIFWHGSAFSGQLSDPTRPAGMPSAGKRPGIKTAPRWVLSSTLIAPMRRLATINGKTVRVGDKVNAAEVVHIAPDRVALRIGSKRLVLRFGPRDYKRIR